MCVSSLNEAECCRCKVNTQSIWPHQLVPDITDNLASDQRCYEIILKSGQFWKMVCASPLPDSLMISLFSGKLMTCPWLRPVVKISISSCPRITGLSDTWHTDLMNYWLGTFQYAKDRWEGFIASFNAYLNHFFLPTLIYICG